MGGNKGGKKGGYCVGGGGGRGLIQGSIRLMWK